MSYNKTLRKKISPDKTQKHQSTPLLPSGDPRLTMEIPVNDIIEQMSYENSYYIDITCPGMDDKRIHLGKEEIVMGRGDNCTVKLPITNVSRLHARIFLENEEYIIEDLNSTNGTFVNNVRISRCIMRNNDQVKIGAARILFTHEKKAQ
jgi:hypothetical protein